MRREDRAIMIAEAKRALTRRFLAVGTHPTERKVEVELDVDMIVDLIIASTILDVTALLKGVDTTIKNSQNKLMDYVDSVLAKGDSPALDSWVDDSTDDSTIPKLDVKSKDGSSYLDKLVKQQIRIALVRIEEDALDLIRTNKSDGQNYGRSHITNLITKAVEGIENEL